VSFSFSQRRLWPWINKPITSISTFTVPSYIIFLEHGNSLPCETAQVHKSIQKNTHTHTPFIKLLIHLCFQLDIYILQRLQYTNLDWGLQNSCWDMTFCTGLHRRDYQFSRHLQYHCGPGYNLRYVLFQRFICFCHWC